MPNQTPLHIPLHLPFLQQLAHFSPTLHEWRPGGRGRHCPPDAPERGSGGRAGKDWPSLSSPGQGQTGLMTTHASTYTQITLQVHTSKLVFFPVLCAFCLIVDVYHRGGVQTWIIYGVTEVKPVCSRPCSGREDSCDQVKLYCCPYPRCLPR